MANIPVPHATVTPNNAGAVREARAANYMEANRQLTNSVMQIVNAFAGNPVSNAGSNSMAGTLAGLYPAMKRSSMMATAQYSQQMQDRMEMYNQLGY